MPGDEIYYFEVTISMTGLPREIRVGFCEEHTPLDCMVGWDPRSWAYHGDDGRTYTYAVARRGNKFDKKYKKGSTVGCGVNFEMGAAFFTLDGKLIGEQALFSNRRSGAGGLLRQLSLITKLKGRHSTEGQIIPSGEF
ncbi:hypothetical protein B0T25DRAFT_458213 [Lasiosphaeria hispida]|uniref:B30.2/SPRY domain-containing protein n=1 Tax=Lasiosphaeria hispida TaxID=260671 RepID=A0AAJ0HE56_9PEZI|nr:hypothetical protein B0T25DRAFT_458213 [Lasiosphaeria hispida]